MSKNSKKQSKKNNNNTNNNNNLLSSVLGMFNFFSVISCKSSDTDWYCMLQKIIQSIMGIFSILLIFYVIYIYVYN